MPKSTSLKTSTLNAYLNNIADDDLLAAGAAANLYASLHTAAPGAAGVQTTSEASYTGYSRVAIARSSGSPAWTVSGASAVNAADVAWGACTAGSATVTHWAIGKASTGGSRILYRGVFGTDKGPFVGENSNDQITNKGHGLSIDDRVAFYADPNASLPTGITEGTVYFVKSVPDSDNITISTTSGGSTVDITADGSGIMYKVVPLAIVAGITPRALAGQMSIIEE